MNRKFRYHLNKLVFPLFCFLLLFYFIYHLLSGDHGWFSWRTLEKDLEADQKTLEFLEKEKQALENKVNLLRSDHIDPDMLDERIRTMLNNAQENEIIVIDKEI